MISAINQLKISLETAEINEPINRREGNSLQADLEAKNAADFRQVIRILEAVSHGPIWPEPSSNSTGHGDYDSIPPDPRG